MKKKKDHAQSFGSHMSLIDFGGVMVPIGFLASFRKLKHADCLSGKGFTTQFSRTRDGKEQRIQTLCDCALTRAIDRLKRVGRKALHELSVAWIDEENQRLELNEKACRQEGIEAAVDAQCPYPAGTDQMLAWHVGHAETLKRIEDEKNKAKSTEDSTVEKTGKTEEEAPSQSQGGQGGG